ncbi:hypothetical protein PIB30_105486 [Stylosanthes scabra]|uniref:Uncharacterized protein n=1 Tax=Stylosanthes scabra TaxID=79078 RepID=A0ABU6W2H0_9FABA|nr:hypothetical protein [Stylosanthes scabra]
MPRAKQTTKRTRNEEVAHMEPPSDHPLFQYFSRLDDLNNYIFNFSERKEISPRNIQREEEEQAPPPQTQEQQEAQAGPSEQPSMRDMMQVLLRIEQNQANMDIHLTRVDQRLSRIEQYLEINEDEDQD